MSTTDRYVTRVWSAKEDAYRTPKWNYMVRYDAGGNIESFWRELTINPKGIVYVNTVDSELHQGIVRVQVTELESLTDDPEIDGLNMMGQAGSEVIATVAQTAETQEGVLLTEEDKTALLEALDRIKAQTAALEQIPKQMGQMMLKQAELMIEREELQTENERLKKEIEDLQNLKIDQVQCFLKREEKLQLQNRHLEYQIACLRRKTGGIEVCPKEGLRRTDGGFITRQPRYNNWGAPGWPPKAEVQLPTRTAERVEEQPKSEKSVEE